MKKTLVSVREGIPLNSQKFYDNDKILSQGLKSGKHIFQIMQANDLGVSKSTVYNHANKGYYSFSNLEFPRKVKFKSRCSKPRNYVATGLKTGRTYADFEEYLYVNNISHWVEMDTVIGRQGGKAILTLHFTLCNFMFGFIVDNLSSDCIASKITEIKGVMRENGLLFGDYFPALLTDNGGEFANIFAFENDHNGKQSVLL